MSDTKSPSLLTPGVMWEAVRSRNPRFDGSFVYGVRSTKVYCRPSCPSRRPRFNQVRFFYNPREAASSGFRACLRCRPDSVDSIIKKVGAVGAYIDAHPGDPLTLRALAERFHASPYHLQRSFKRLVGVTPREYADGARLRRLRLELKRGGSVRQSTYGVGRSSTGWLYEGESKLGMDASTYKRGGSGKEIQFSIVPCSLGHLLVAGTDEGICMVAIGDSEAAMRRALNSEFPNAVLLPGDDRVSSWVRTIVEYLEGGVDTRIRQLPLEIQASAFQRRVWNELRSIPAGSTRSYGEVAEMIGRPSAVRAVARACATNPVALLIPCHRVVGSDGTAKGYRWGVERKIALLRIEGKAVAEPDR